MVPPPLSDVWLARNCLPAFPRTVSVLPAELDNCPICTAVKLLPLRLIVALPVWVTLLPRLTPLTPVEALSAVKTTDEGMVAFAIPGPCHWRFSVAPPVPC